MATGDQGDSHQRIKSLLPPWFGDPDPVLTSALQGYAWAVSFVYSLYVYAKLQTRILTATDGWLDMIAADFFGTTLPRRAHEVDEPYRGRIIINMFRPRATRASVTRVLLDLTGRAPKIFEPRRPADTGAYGSAQSLAYGMAGAYGSMLMPFQALIDAYRPATTGIPNVIGYGAPAGGYGIASQIEYADIAMIQGPATDANIYAAIDSVAPAGTILWTRING